MKYRHPRHALYDDLMWLLDQGVGHLEAAARVGVSVAAAARWFRRHGHRDHALIYERVHREKYREKADT